MNGKRNDISICALIGLSFLWTGSAYLSWFYHLAEFYDGRSVDMFTEVFGYLMQAAGLAVFALYRKKDGGNASSRYSFSLISAAGLVMAFLAALSPTGSVSLVFGYGMNAVFGMIAAAYLYMLADHSSASHSGIVFGAGYGIGSILSYLISLIGDGNFLADPKAFIIYALICAANVPLSVRIIDSGSGTAQTPFAPAGRGPASAAPDLFNYLWLPGITILLLSCVKSGGFYFPAADLGDHNVSLELSRSFYAAGLIAAGLINDRRRSAGAVLCVAALVFPFFTMIAGAHSGISYVLWITGYIFFGFYSVYRVLLFTDISRSVSGLACLACVGLMWGRIGDAAGAAIGMTLGQTPMVLITVMAALFVICIFLFFRLYQMMYMQPVTSEPDHVLQFASAYGLSQRESDLLRLILGGNTNKEIAEKLFISENTVKFHVRNLLRKTGCKKRGELLSLFDSFRSPQ